jgi:hypothetical protein
MEAWNECYRRWKVAETIEMLIFIVNIDDQRDFR